MRSLLALTFLLGAFNSAHAQDASWSTECGQILISRTRLIKSTPIVILSLKGNSLILDPGNFDKDYYRRLDLIAQALEFAPVCVTGSRQNGKFIPHKMISANSSAAARRQMEILTEPARSTPKKPQIRERAERTPPAPPTPAAAPRPRFTFPWNEKTAP